MKSKVSKEQAAVIIFYVLKFVLINVGKSHLDRKVKRYKRIYSIAMFLAMPFIHRALNEAFLRFNARNLNK